MGFFGGGGEVGFMEKMWGGAPGNDWDGEGRGGGKPEPAPLLPRCPKLRSQIILIHPGNMVDSLAGFGKVVLFRQEKPGGLTYRIPALLYLPLEATFLAFAEERSSPRDEDAKFLVMRRGRKDGKTVQWGPPKSLLTATLPKYRTMNPCPVYDKQGGTVFLFFICVLDHVSVRRQIVTGRNAARLCYISSQDGGCTWSQATDLTGQVTEDDQRSWASFAVGPGHGVQLATGRLVVPAYAYHVRRCCLPCFSLCGTKPHSFAFYSDDGGQSWAQGQLLERPRATECQVAEVIGQDESPVLYVNARSACWDRCRAEAYSTDGGRRFQGASLCRELCETPHGCQGSVVSFAAQPASSDLDPEEGGGEPSRAPVLRPSSTSLESATSWLVFSHPTSRRKRTDLGIYLNTSPLEKGCWRKPWVLNQGPSGYSDLAVCKEVKSLMFGCLFESGVSSACEEIAFRLFTDAELLRHTREGASEEHLS